MSNFKFDFYPEEVQFPSASPRAPSAIAPPAASTRRASEDNESTVEQALSPYLARRLKPEDYVGTPDSDNSFMIPFQPSKPVYFSVFSNG